MKCPKCSNPIAEGKVHGEPANKCVKCGGIWLETGELRAFFERVLANNPKLKPKKPAKSDAPLAGTFYKTGRDCPECGRQMEKTYYAYDSGIPIEHCVPCGGTWVDKTQINQLAGYLKDNAESIVYEGGAPTEYIGEEAIAADSRLAWLTPLVALVIAIVCTVVLIQAGRILYNQIVAAQAKQESLDWVEIEGTLEGVTVRTYHGTGFGLLGGEVFAIRKRYTYSFLGQAYESHATWPNGDDYMTRDSMRGTITKSFDEPGDPVAVYIDPENPERSCLLRGINRFRQRHRNTTLIAQLAVAGLVLIGALWTLFRWRYPSE